MLTLEQVNLLLAALQAVQLPGAAIDLAYSTKQTLTAMKAELALKKED